jgi:hypothetical protein
LANETADTSLGVGFPESLALSLGEIDVLASLSLGRDGFFFEQAQKSHPIPVTGAFLAGFKLFEFGDGLGDVAAVVHI